MMRCTYLPPRTALAALAILLASAGERGLAAAAEPPVPEGQESPQVEEATAGGSAKQQEQPAPEKPAADRPAEGEPERELRLPPGGSDARAFQAWRMIRQEQYEPAEALLKRVLEQYPDYSQAQFFLGVCYKQQRDHARARRAFERVLEMDVPFHQDEATYYFYGWSLYWLGELDEARAAFEKHIEASPHEPDSHFALGLIDYDENKLDAAEKRFRKSLELLDRMSRTNPQRYRGRLNAVSKAHVRLADVHVRRGELQEARKELELAIDIWPRYPEPYYKLSRVLFRLGEREAARQMAERHQTLLRMQGNTNDGG